MNCYRCEQQIKSGRVRKRVTYDPPIMKTYHYCRHCFKAIEAATPIIEYQGVNNG